MRRQINFANQEPKNATQQNLQTQYYQGFKEGAMAVDEIWRKKITKILEQNVHPLLGFNIVLADRLKELLAEEAIHE